jgi:hypothetical protein
VEKKFQNEGAVASIFTILTIRYPEVEQQKLRGIQKR